MIVLFGTKQKVRQIGVTKEYRCDRCNNVRPWQVLEVTNWFTLFFLPLFPISKKVIERCPVCGGYNILSKEEAAAYEAAARR